MRVGKEGELPGKTEKPKERIKEGINEERIYKDEELVERVVNALKSHSSDKKAFSALGKINERNKFVIGKEEAENKAKKMIAECKEMYPDVEKIARLIMEGAELNKQDENGDTALIVTARTGYYGHMPILEMLIECGVNLNLQNKEGSTALKKTTEGANFFNYRTIKLVEAGAELNIWDNEGYTPLMDLAARFNEVEV